MKQKLAIGWASRDVTPDRPVNLRGQFHARITDRVRDPVTVTALALSAGKSPGASLVWVSCDTVAIPDEVIAMSRAKLGKLVKDFPVKNLVLNATHTHTAPAMGDSWHSLIPPGVMSAEEYATFFTDHVAAAAAAAWRGRKAGYLAWGMGYAPIGHGRRATYFDDLSQRPDVQDLPGMKVDKTARMYGSTNDDRFDCIESYADHSTHLLFTFDARKKLTGAVINVCCTAQETEHLEEISADFWHETRVALRQRHGQSLFVLPQCSAAGGLSPHLMFNQRAKRRLLELKGISQRQDIADRIVAAFADTLPWASKELHARVEIKHAAKRLLLPLRKITRTELAQVRKDLAALVMTPLSTAPTAAARLREDSILESRTLRCRRIIERYREQLASPGFPMELHVVRIGDIAFATNAFELFSDYGIRIQARSPALQTCVVQHCGRGTYLPTRLAVRGGGYSACLYCNLVGPEGGDVLVEETVKALIAQWGKPKRRPGE